MPTELPRQLLEVRYYHAAQDYLRKLPLDGFRDETLQATQRKITLESLDLLRANRSDVQVFNKLLVQYQLPRRKRLRQLVPDNMVVLHAEPIKAEWSYDVHLQPVSPFWMLEYVSKSNRRKDYDDKMRKYEDELKVPYCMFFVPHLQELTLYHHTGERYASVPPNKEGRHPIPELSLEIGLHDGWVRYWYDGELLPTPAEMQQALDDVARELAALEQRDETESRRAETESRRAETESRRAETESRRAETESRRAETESRRAEMEMQARLAAEREVAELRVQVEALRAQKKIDA